MLKGIPHIISPELFYVLMSMGHGDEIVFGDANFPADSMAERIVRAKKAYAIVATGETALYANIILKKGVVRLYMKEQIT